ncbi:Lrp/AsnC family transcriptional regulator [Paraburkholderia sp. ZP32-5]|uniref:Lrp/AsnC family transcriptional regulator n=1 Tax=Paraburkholderia sp. ZP32-5 TaxID=2883245 RepID=UPI001F264E72|nr:Lrp/AsnC ligand binding domain-containing protein [Paraburkholderia sp. ZP32-5]
MNATKIRASSRSAARSSPSSASSASSARADPLPALDRIDRAILRQLQADASISNVALAAKVRLSAPACLRRVERLKESGLIRGVVALLDPKAAGAGMLVIIGVVLDRSTPESFAEFEKAAQKVAGCMECHVVTGEFDYFMVIRTRDSDSFNRLHAEQLLYLPGVRQIRSFMVLKEILSTTQFPL